MASRFQDGAWLCELATAHDDEELAQVVAATLGVLPRPATSLTASILDALRRASSSSCSTTASTSSTGRAARRRTAPGVSRGAHAGDEPRSARCGRRAGVAARALELPAPTSTVEDIASSRAVQLFIERARAVQPTFVLDEVNAAAVAEICRRLDGIPLAVELAAARVTIMTPTDIAARLDQRFQLLTGGRRSAAERHQTLRGAIEWSYEMLEPTRTEALRARSACSRRSFDAEAVAAVAASEGLEAWDVLDAGAGLVAKSMIMADDSQRHAPATRCWRRCGRSPGSDSRRAGGSTRCSGVTPSTTRGSPRRPTRGWPDPTRPRGARASTSSSTTSGSRSSAA